MFRRVLVALVSWAALCGPALAQVSGLTWPGSCFTEVPFRNNSGFPLGSIWIAIEDDDVNNPPEINGIGVNPGSGLPWAVDDNEDGDDDDGLPETNGTDSTPQGNPTGWHRVQARFSSQVIAPGQSYTLMLCAQGSSSLRNKEIRLLGVAPGPGGAGDGGENIASDPQTLPPGGEVEITLDPSELPPLADLTFSFKLTNGSGSTLDKLRVTARQSDVTVIDVTSSSGGSWNGELFLFTIPIPPGGSQDMGFTLDQLHVPRPLGTEPTEVVFHPIFPATGPLPAWLLPAVFVALAIAGASLVARRSRLTTPRAA